MRSGALLLVASLLAACSPAPPAAPPAPGAAAPPAPRADAPPAAVTPEPQPLDLFGEWQVAAFETPLLAASERSIGDPTRIAVLIGVGSILASSQCIPFSFRYRRTEERIEIAPQHWRGSVCARGLLPFERVFGRVLGGAVRLEEQPGRVRLSGPAGSVTLVRPAGGFLANPFGNQPAPGPRLFWGHFRLVEAGGVPVSETVDLAVGQHSIEARSGCVIWRWARDPLRGDGGYSADPLGMAVCERGLTDAEQALERVIPAVRSLDWIAPYRVRLGGPAGSVVLERVGAGG